MSIKEMRLYQNAKFRKPLELIINTFHDFPNQNVHLQPYMNFDAVHILCTSLDHSIKNKDIKWDSNKNIMEKTYLSY